jgi:hypothetical protein
LAKRLKGVRIQFLSYEPPSKNWDHDHCAACTAKSGKAEASELLHEGYTTCDDCKHGARDEWICKNCFAESKDEVRWTVTE